MPVSQYCMKGRTWLFPDSDINTDQIMPGHTFVLPEEERKKFVLESVRPGWNKIVGKDEIIVGGRNFGVGSGRPCGHLLRSLGVIAIVAESVNGLFLRGCLNSGLIALSCPGVTAMFADGDIAEIDPLQGNVVNTTKNATLVGQKLPANLLELAASGGLLESLLKDGSISLG